MSNSLFIVGMVALTFIPRYIPFLLAGKIALPQWAKRALHYVPIAVLTAIIAQVAMVHDGQLDFSLGNFHALAALAAFIAAVLTRQLFVTIAVGLVCFGLLRAGFGA